MIAANWSIRPLGSIVETSMGWGIVVDTGEFINTYPYVARHLTQKEQERVKSLSNYDFL